MKLWASVTGYYNRSPAVPHVPVGGSALAPQGRWGLRRSCSSAELPQEIRAPMRGDASTSPARARRN